MVIIECINYLRLSKVSAFRYRHLNMNSIISLIMLSQFGRNPVREIRVPSLFENYFISISSIEVIIPEYTIAFS